MKHAPALEQLIDALRTLPGVGPKSAQRMAFHLLQDGRRRCACAGRLAHPGVAVGELLLAVSDADAGRTLFRLCEQAA